MSNYKRKEVMDYLTRKPVTAQDYQAAIDINDLRPRAPVPVSSIEQPETDYQTEVQPDMVVPPQDVLPKGAEPVMPSAPGIPNPQDRILELATGGVVAREGFKYGTSKAFKEFLEKQISKNKTVYNSLDELINKSNTNINQENAIKVLKNEYPDSFKIKVEKEYFPIHENPKETLKAIDGFKKLKEWEKNPTAENWFSIFRVTEPSGKTKPSKFSQGLRNYVQGKEGEGATFNKYFDKIELDEKLYNEIKTYDKDLANTLKAKAGNQAAKKAIFEKSDQAINDINEQFKFDPNSSLEEITEALYGNQFKNADSKNKLILTTQTSDDVAKYLKVLQGARPEQAKKIKLPDQETINDIVDNIAAGKKGGFRFQEGTLRQYKFDIRDTLLGLEAGTSSQLRSKVPGGGKRVIDESVGLSATYERAPGYTEASQFLSPETNRIKGLVIDRPFNKTLDKALGGDLSGVKEYNKIARQFKKEYPDADVPIIEIGVSPEKTVKYFDSFSEEAKKNILDIYNKSNISIRTNSRPLSLLVNDYQKAEKLEGKAKTAAFTALGLTSAGVATATEVPNLTPTESINLTETQDIFKSPIEKTTEFVKEKPGTVATGAGAAATAPSIISKLKPILSPIGSFIGGVINPAVVGLEGYRITEDIKKGVPPMESISGFLLMDEPIKRQKILNRMGDDASLLVKQTKGMAPPDGLENYSMEQIEQFYNKYNLKPDPKLIQKYLDSANAFQTERNIVAKELEPRFKEIPSYNESEKYATGGRVKFASGSDDPESDLYIPPLNKEDISGTNVPKEGIDGLYFGTRQEQRPIPVDPMTGKPILSGGMRELKQVFSSLLSDTRPEAGYRKGNIDFYASKGINPFQGDTDFKYGASYTPEGNVGKFMIDKTPQYLGAGYTYQKDGLDFGITGLKNQMGDKSIALRFGYNYATGGRVGFQVGGSANFLKMLRNISDSIRELKNSTHMLGYTAKSEGVAKAAEEALAPYAGGFKGNKHETLLQKIQNAKEHLPKEYHGVLDEMKSYADKHAYDAVDDMAKALDKIVDPNLKFENLSKKMFPMEDPLNDAFIIIDPEKGHSVGRYVQRHTINPETGRGIIQTVDTWDPVNRRFLPNEEHKLIGVESIEKGKEGLN